MKRNLTFEALEGRAMLAHWSSLAWTPVISIASRSTVEGNSGQHDEVFRVSLSHPSWRTITATVDTADSSAIAGVDYLPINQQITFLPGQTSLSVSVPILGDTIVESNETFLVMLSGVHNAWLRNPVAVGTILNDDIAPPQLPSPPPTTTGTFPTGFGVNIHTGPTWKASDIALIAADGFKWVRSDLFWQYTERTEGVYNWSEYDTLAAGFQAYGIKILFTLDYNNPIYGAANDKVGPSTQTEFLAYAKWAAAAVQHFAGHGYVWEIWNEPNDAHFWQPAPNLANYMTLETDAYNAIKAVAPNELVIGPTATYAGSGSLPDQAISFLQSTFDAGLLNTVDAVSVHLYRPHGGAPETVLPWLALYDNLTAGYAVKRPLVSSEWGTSRTEVSEPLQAAYIVRQFAINAVSGIPLSIWYDFMDGGTDTTNREDMFGLVDVNRQPHLAYTSAKVFNNIAANATSITRLASDPNDYLVQFDGTTMEWTTGVSHAVPLPASATKAMDMLGQPYPINADGTVTISDMPIYVT